MSAYYGVPEGDEISLNGVTKQAVDPVTEPVDDPNLIISLRPPERDFAVQRTSRMTRTYGAPKRAPFGGVDFEAMLANAS